MNFLAHIYLSGEDPELMLGNFMADAVKGKKYLTYPKPIQNGIILHRAIDYYTDTHPVVRQSISRLFPVYRHYSGVIIDVLYDHFLAKYWNDFHTQELESYIKQFYELLSANAEVLPNRVKNFYPYMIRDNWLGSYTTLPGLKKILGQMNRRTGEKGKLDQSITEIEADYALFKNEFFTFFPDLITFVQAEMDKLDS
ncbi:acyl carrier protein phosphodiesterase [Gangjinia marincola]|uniref:Acyl carrier protein phosphodiesterase n=1 Tax=Gangjinia marincola TaxID=578463 RepID=A0ABN1MF65_9FLAO